MFWGLSWYELSLYIEQFRVKTERREQLEKNNWIRWRTSWAQYHNGTFKNRVKPTDIIKFDDDVEEEKKKSTLIPPEEVEKRFKKSGKR